MSPEEGITAISENAVTLRNDAGVGWIVLNRPDRLNALAGNMRDRLAEAIATSASDPETRVIVITGAGRAFCAGADLEAMSDLLARDDHQSFAALVQAGARVIRCIREAPQPVLAAVNGVAAGAGASLATACDFRIASDRASIGFTFNRIGLHPDWGATFFLPRLVGRGRAAELIFTGRVVPADEAARIGLFERVVPDETFPDQVASLAAELASKPPLALAEAKASLNDPTVRVAMEEAMRREAEAQLACFRSRDVQEGVAAFREKRPPIFTGG